jgi:hypothetical protein
MLLAKPVAEVDKFSLQRFEQKGPNGPANQSPDFLHVGHFTFITALIYHQKWQDSSNPQHSPRPGAVFDWLLVEYRFRHVK